MAKLYGAFSSETGSALLRQKAEAMLETLGAARLPSDVLRDLGSGSVAAAGPDVAVSSDVCAQSFRSAVLLGGSLYDGVAPDERYKVSWPAQGEANAADLAAALLAARGPQALRDMNGVFSLVHHDLTTGRILVANDRYGFFPLYYYTDKDLLLVASECKAICAVTGGFSPDWGGYGDFFYLGHLQGKRTLFRGIQALGPGEYLEWSGGRTECRRYWDSSSIAVRDERDVPVAEVHERFSRAVGQRLEPSLENTLLLSAGFDSRLILGAMLEHGYRPGILSIAYAQERGFAERLVARLGLAAEIHAERQGLPKFRDSLDAFYVCDGMKTTFHLNPLPCTSVYPWLPSRLQRVWDGTLIGATMGTPFQLEGSLEWNLRHYLYRQSMHRPVLKKLLRPEYFERLEAGFREGLEAETATVTDNADGWLRYLIKNRQRRRMVLNPYQILNRKARPVTPGCDHALLDFLLTIPYEARRDRRLSFALFRHYDPRLQELPVVSGGQYFDLAREPGPSRARGLASPLAALVRNSGLAPLAKAVMAGFGRSEYTQPGFMCHVVRMKGLDRGPYRKDYVEKILRRVEGGSRVWITALSLVFFMELWRLMFEDRMFGVLMRELDAVAGGEAADAR